MPDFFTFVQVKINPLEPCMNNLSIVSRERWKTEEVAHAWSGISNLTYVEEGRCNIILGMLEYGGEVKYFSWNIMFNTFLCNY